MFYCHKHQKANLLNALVKRNREDPFFGLFPQCIANTRPFGYQQFFERYIRQFEIVVIQCRSSIAFALLLLFHEVDNVQKTIEQHESYAVPADRLSFNIPKY